MIDGRACWLRPPPLGFASGAFSALAAGSAAPPSASAAGAAAPPEAFASAFAPPLASAFAPSCFAAAFFGFAGALVAAAPLPNAFAASASSTLEAGAVTPRPAFWRISRASFEVIPRSLAISWTRFFAMR